MLVPGITILVFVLIIVLFAVLRWKPKYALEAAFVGLLVSAIMYSTHRYELAKIISTYASGFLAAACIIALIDYLRRGSAED